MDPVARIVAMLGSDDPDKRQAAVIVLGELKVRAAKAVQALLLTLEDAGPALQSQVLRALRGAKRAVPDALGLLGSRDKAVREAAVELLVAVGDSILPKVKARLTEAGPEERRGLDAVLARLGGKQAFSALLAGLDDAEDQEANAAAIAMREQVREADKKQRRSYRTQLEGVLSRQEKRKKGTASEAAVRAALKMLGYLEDAAVAPTLLKFARTKRWPPGIRQEALIALRFTFQGGKPDAKVVSALVAAALDDDRSLAQTALITLAGLSLPAKVADKLAPLLDHEDIERVRFAIDMLAHRATADAAELLVNVLASGDERRADLAREALQERADAAPALLRALLEATDGDRARAVGGVLRHHASALKPAQLKKLMSVATARLGAGEDGWLGPFIVAHEVDPIGAGDALRALYKKLRKARKTERAVAVLKELCRTDQGAPDDRFELALRLLEGDAKDTAPGARRSSEGLGILERLARQRYDVYGSLLRERKLDLEALYFIGFHFLEEGRSLGEDLLHHVMEEGGRKKVAKMAKNKLRL